MKVKINLENPHFQWNITEINDIKCWTKGNIFYKNEIIKAPEIIKLISSLPNIDNRSNDAIKDLFFNFYGFFVLVIETPEMIITAVDWIRSIPLFYIFSETAFILSDNPSLLQREQAVTLSQESIVEFLLSAIVSGNNTFFNEIKQVRPGECIIYNKKMEKISTQKYFNYIYNNSLETSDSQLIGHLDNVFNDCFQRCLQSTINDGKKLIVPLSGGLDSRIIVAMLKRFGVNDVICYSYGKNNNYESKISKMIADALNYEWHFVEYTRDNWNDCYESSEMNGYFSYSQNFVSVPHEQDFLAVKILKEEGILPYNSVFLPGHSGDLFRGHLLNKEDFLMTNPDKDQLINKIIEKHYDLWEIPSDGITLSQLKDRISMTIAPFTTDNLDSYINALDYFNITERQAKNIINSVRTYEYFDYEWGLPLFERELVDFFLGVPIRQKFQNNKVLIRWFNHKFSSLSQIPCTTPLDDYINYKKKVSSLAIALIDQFFSGFRDTKTIRYGNVVELSLYSSIKVKNQFFDKSDVYNQILSILFWNIENAKKISFNGIQTVNFLIPFIVELENYLQTER